MSSLRNNYGKIVNNDKGTFLAHNLTLDGTPLGVANSNVNGSVTPVEFYMEPSANVLYNINAIHLVISDGGAPAVGQYGNLSALTNGIQLFAIVNGIETIFTNIFKRNEDYMKISSSYDVFSLSGSDRAIIYRNLIAADDEAFTLDGSRGDKFGVRIRDDLTSISIHEFQCAVSVFRRF